ncbi:MAG: hypothetical protein Q4F95_14575 [Oscillospiraceae bacterium]|nr:hypothetical protein [Oscillospiraceae bacterium]
MRMIYVDKAVGWSDDLKSIFSDFSDIELAGIFSDFTESEKYISANHTDIAFMCFDEDKSHADEILDRFKKNSPDIKIIFVSLDKELAYDALNTGAAGYLLKPFTRSDVKRILEHNNILKSQSVPQIYIKTMPYFDVFINGKVFPISSAKAKEMLALLVDRNGGTVSSGQVISCLWEDRADDEKTRALCRMTFKRLRDVLLGAGIADLLATNNSQHYINTEMFDSDYRRILRGDAGALREYNGDYMSEYSWAEETNAKLSRYLG